MGPHSTGGLYLNFPGLGEEKEELVKAGYGVNYERLAKLKAEYAIAAASAGGHLDFKGKATGLGGIDNAEHPKQC